jgi:hypothetical protein
MINGLVVDQSKGLIWVNITVPDDEWAEGLVESPYPEGTGYEIGEADKYYDTIVEVIDPDRGEVIASQRYDEWLMDLTGQVLPMASHPGPGDVPLPASSWIWKAGCVRNLDRSPDSRDLVKHRLEELEVETGVLRDYVAAQRAMR